ncbi:MAG: hypothetical protein U9O56_08830 [Campylobacterota bacterium]|nr:hypothetical protein [Campylobacterota bacterium]
MIKDNNNFLKISYEIKNLVLDDIYNNLFFYNYHSRYLKKLQTTNMDQGDPHYISTYCSFIGEVYENIIYELLLKYAISNTDITKFILKGPHQNHYDNGKNGLMMDLNSQIVYKAGYKDVTEFDALFFTEDSVCFVESTIVKTTTSLRKRLRKKKALLEVLFPKLKVKALIILTKGALGINVFPPYCTVWVTEPLDDKKLLNTLIYENVNHDKRFITYREKKLIHAKDVRLFIFKYYDTLSWILRNIRKNTIKVIDFDFLSTQKLTRYFEIYSKFYIGYCDIDNFIKVLNHHKIKEVSEDIPLDKIYKNQVMITIEKTKENYELVYYMKVIGEKLKRLDLDLLENKLSISNKDPKGFTSAEVKYMQYLFEKSYKLNIDNIIKIYQSLINH